MSAERSWTPSADLLDELAVALRTTDGLGYTNWFDVVDHTVITLTFDPSDADPDGPADGQPDWIQDEHRLAARILADAERYREVPGIGCPGRLHDFIRSVRDPTLQQVLWDAARRGRGAYRRVRGALRQRGLEQLWHDYEAEANRELALDWLRTEGLLPGAR